MEGVDMHFIFLVRLILSFFPHLRNLIFDLLHIPRNVANQKLHFRELKLLDKYGLKTTAKIVDAIKYGEVYNPVIEYTVQGKTVELELHYGNPVYNEMIGGKMEVRYNPRNIELCYPEAFFDDCIKRKLLEKKFSMVAGVLTPLFMLAVTIIFIVLIFTLDVSELNPQVDADGFLITPAPAIVTAREFYIYIPYAPYHSERPYQNQMLYDELTDNEKLQLISLEREQTGMNQELYNSLTDEEKAEHWAWELSRIKMFLLVRED